MLNDSGRWVSFRRMVQPMTPEPVEIVEGMGELIEARRVACGLTPGQFAAAANVTPQGLEPVRKGVRKNYQDKIRIGVARALDWPPDAIDRLLAGDLTLPTGAPDREDRLAAIEARLERLEALLGELLSAPRPRP